MSAAPDDAADAADASGVGSSPAPPPTVTVIMTALEEEKHLTAAVESVFTQDYDGPLDLVVAVGPSRDSTRALADRLAREHADRMQVVDNPTGRTPAGLNRAIAAIGPGTTVVVRTDGHATLPPSYVRTAVDVLQRTGAANVGGMMVPEGSTTFERAVARAMSEPIGLGSVPFHVGGEAGPADTVYLGVFTRSVLDKTGGFDEHFARAQDWELNHRIRDLGETVWFDPRLQVTYRPRPNLRRLATQFHGSGRWRWQIIRAYPATASARYLAAPGTTFVLGAAAATLIGNAATRRNRVVGAIAGAAPAGYLAVVLGGAARSRRGLSRGASAWYPAVLVTMHLSWGSGFLAEMFSDAVTAARGRRRRVPVGGGR
ncbi:Glycosyltransferase like family 2 [Jatrophihabitans endophyticus]|uniref:Glycosyltransferase like family 2 n=1 Tax=Jatrophihabitans endophyticus TaxID=1206085 RepID=A0A1M5I2W5_9ACTN|nr:glycosyltransferase family 2 protein [Jatrophihabitans endophyticus]SHG22517.1 Glycosyltransferase like family 2 [Jatrophihabitans endophyticus]